MLFCKKKKRHLAAVIAPVAIVKKEHLVEGDAWSR
jgi:hypothetical protein